MSPKIMIKTLKLKLVNKYDLNSVVKFDKYEDVDLSEDIAKYLSIKPLVLIRDELNKERKVKILIK
jgi:hypothetical protein